MVELEGIIEGLYRNATTGPFLPAIGQQCQHLNYDKLAVGKGSRQIYATMFLSVRGSAESGSTYMFPDSGGGLATDRVRPCGCALLWVLGAWTRSRST